MHIKNTQINKATEKPFFKITTSLADNYNITYIRRM